jgi:hypothetical protein
MTAAIKDDTENPPAMDRFRQLRHYYRHPERPFLACERHCTTICYLEASPGSTSAYSRCPDKAVDMS